MKVVSCLLLLTLAVPAFACEPFREPAVNFSGITTEAELIEYFGGIEQQYNSQQDRLHECHRRAMDNAPRGGLSDQRNRNDLESDRWIADMSAFNKQAWAMGKAHLALLAAQPFKGAYDPRSVASTGGASRSASTVNSSPGNPSGNSLSASASSSAKQSRSAASGGRPTYQPFTNCVQITPPGPNQPQRIHNVCDQPLEVYWQDAGGGWSMTTIAAGQYYSGGEKPMRTLACHKGDLYTKDRGLCTEW